MSQRNIERTHTEHIAYPTNDAELAELSRQKRAERKELGYISRNDYALSQLKERIYQTISEALPENTQNNANVAARRLHLAAVPPKHTGDYALQIPDLMKTDMKRYRTEILPRAKELIDAAASLPVSDCILVGPFLNITLDKAAFIYDVVNDIQLLKERYGQSDLGEEKLALVEYSSPNIGKSLHIGHLGTTLLGHIFGNVMHTLGFTTLRVSHLGDWGLPIGLLKVAIEEFGEEPEILALKEDTPNYFATLYARIHKESEARPELRARAQKAFADLENDDQDMKRFWEEIRALSIATFDTFYDYFNLSLDASIGEAYYIGGLDRICAEVEKLDVARIDGEALVLELEQQNMGTVLLKKSDGATTYLTRDLVAITKRHEIFNYDRCYYVVGSEQTTHLRQLFFITKLLGGEYAENCCHIPIGLLQQGGKKISSRKGNALTPEELLEATIAEAEKLVVVSLPEESVKVQKKIAHQIATGAMLYTQVLTTPGKNIEFNLVRMLDLKGKTGPYLQYTAVRAKSILRKVGSPTLSITEISKDTIEGCDQSVYPLVKLLAQFPDTITSCFEASSPHPLAHYLHELAQCINVLYQTVRFKETEGELQQFYLLIVQSSLETLQNGLRILNIESPEKM